MREHKNFWIRARTESKFSMGDERRVYGGFAEEEISGPGLIFRTGKPPPLFLQAPFPPGQFFQPLLSYSVSFVPPARRASGFLPGPFRNKEPPPSRLRNGLFQPFIKSSIF